MKRIKAAVMIMGVAGYALTAAAAPQPIPFTDGFESGTNGAPYTGAGWSYSGASVVATNPATTPDDGSTKSLYTTESAALSLSAAGKSNVWFLGDSIMSTYPTNTDAQPSISDAAAAFFLNTSGELKAYSNNAFVVVKTGLDTNDWVGFAVQLDFASKKWNIYLRSQGTANPGNLALANTNGPLAFRSGYTGGAITNVEVGGITYLDTVKVLAGAGLVTADSPDTITPRTVSYSSTNQWYSSRVSDKTYGAGENDLGGQLGADLAAGLSAGDYVRVYTTNGWQRYILESDGMWTAVGGSTAPGLLTLVPGQPVWFQFATPVADRFALYDSEWIPAALAAQNARPASLIINATGGAPAGWTAFLWDSGNTRRIHPNGNSGFPTDLAAGSVIFVVSSNGQYTRGYWTGAAWSTIGGQAITLTPGDVVWIYNKGVAKTWTVQYQ